MLLGSVYSPLSMSCTSHLPLTTHSAVFFFLIFNLVPGGPDFVVWPSAQEDKSYSKSCRHVGSVKKGKIAIFVMNLTTFKLY